MGKFNGVLICTDLDGTLLKNDKSISKQNLDAIEYFKNEGGFFTFITGRMPFFVSDIYEKVNPNAPFGCINGGGVYDHRKKQYIWTQTLQRDAIVLVEYADKNLFGLGIQVNTFDKTYFCRENQAMADFRKRTNMPNIVRDYKDVDEPIAKIVFGDIDESKITELAKLLNSHPMANDVDFIRSEQTLYEILPKGISKGTVISKLVSILGIDKSKTIAIGDYNNDVSMLRTAQIGVAVSNAVPEAKAAADYITVSNEEHAIAKVINDIDKYAMTI